MNDVGPRGIYCPRCKRAVTWPAQLDEFGKAQLAASARAGRLPTVQRLTRDDGMALGEAKALVNHVSRAENVCHRCKHTICTGESICASCRSANLNW